MRRPMTSMLRSIMLLVKIEKQLRKHKEKAQALRNKKGSQSKDITGQN